jgi:hypothetical protein
MQPPMATDSSVSSSQHLPAPSKPQVNPPFSSFAVHTFGASSRRAGYSFRHSIMSCVASPRRPLALPLSTVHITRRLVGGGRMNMPIWPCTTISLQHHDIDHMVTQLQVFTRSPDSRLSEVEACSLWSFGRRWGSRSEQLIAVIRIS